VKRTPLISPFGSPALPTVPLSTPTSHPSASSGSALPPLQPIPTPFLIEASTPLPRLDLGRKYTIHDQQLFSFSQSEPRFEPSRTVITYAAYSPRVNVDGKSNSIHNLDYLNLVNRYAYPFYKMTYSDVDVLPQLLLLYSVGTHRVPEHSDLILQSHSASSIEELLSTSHSPPLGGSPHRSSSPFGTPWAYGRVPARLRMTRFSAVGRLRPQDHRCAVSPPHLRQPFYSDYSLSSSSRIAFSVSHENRPRDVATNNDWSIVLTFSLIVLHITIKVPASAPGVASSTILPRLYDYQPAHLPRRFSSFSPRYL
jgi:hypothetical protein